MKGDYRYRNIFLRTLHQQGEQFPRELIYFIFIFGFFIFFVSFFLREEAAEGRGGGGGEEGVERGGSYHIQCKSDRAPTVNIVTDFMKETGALANSAKKIKNSTGIFSFFFSFSFFRFFFFLLI